MKKGYNLYFIAIIPPQEICGEVTTLKEEMANRFLSKAALKTLPHITLKAPFEAPEIEHENIIKWFEAMDITVPTFNQQLKNFSAFNNRRNPVIYVEPLMNASLQRLQREVLLKYLDRHPEEPVLKLEVEFKPHITIAYRDLKPSMFKEAWKEFSTRTYHAEFEVDRFYLLKHDSKKWNVMSTHQLKTHE